ncbi:MAG: hypothetical protein FWE68_05625 [Defluviitaleaceae bacterium]|nr:hypothetical protein [Defluviitaleaceae bacterium]
MPYIRKLFAGKKSMLNVCAAFIAGVLLLIASNTLSIGRPAPEPPPPSPEAKAAALPVETGHEEKLESRLEDILSRVEGAGAVRVMITFAQSHEIVVAEDGKYDRTHTEETDAQGGNRTVESLNTSGTKITIKGADGSVTPLILRTIAPRVEGVIIAAQGGGDPVVREQLTRAAQTVLGVEPHKVHVLKIR